MTLSPAVVNYPRILKLFVLPNALFAVAAYFMSGPEMITAFNAALVALASGVVISFLVDAMRTIISHKPMLKVHWLVLGITTHWAGTDGQRVWSIAWRWVGQPMWMTDSRFIAYCLFLSTVGAYFHLAAGESIGEERIPRAKWVRYGALAAAGILIALVLGFVIDQFTEAGVFTGTFG
ncbi:hypothetical protein [Methylobacterium gnaphalii]|uniref:Uncharacterized protein n=1 Tax=Methylobacterium gnaphalii TaxID=1010610 RepID=A0A512JMP1_9HYPH|nr:hypothetical protein [Methylobacterium gnaphalii]GEP11103.1 hypothetical protein MGN01_29480 [Methylobacterium gnaphalii]GJD69893.1 hypothetical protein MMMDOFMJ_2832 [Methylobacterium gnaphalii]GLS50381.1 hypothetical protein GCM10007885_32330 [Methylobacterium gnaphalii]